MTNLRTMLVALSLCRGLAFNLGHQRWISNARTFVGARSMTSKSDQEQRVSVSGTIYSAEDPDAPLVTLFTKDGCTLCDKVKDVLVSVKAEFPHSLKATDITDEGNEMWFSKYKYDIPVLHLDNQFWIKHRLEEGVAREGLKQAIKGTFTAQSGEPDAGEMERRQAERQTLSK